MKKMKKYLIVSIAAFFSVTSCNDFLDKEPYDKKVIESFYKTPADAFEGLVAAYNVLQWDGWGNVFLLSEVASDNCFGGTGKSDDGNIQRIERYQSGVNLNANAWTKGYAGIYRANVLLSNLENVEWGTDEALKVQYEAEAKFLRAYFYFDLVRIFGNVPLVDKPLKPSEAYVTQAAAADVYALIATDLKFAIENLPTSTFQEMSSDTYGRTTKWAAEALMARVFLFYTGYYNQTDIAGVVTKQNVQTYIEDAITNSGHALITGADGFKKLWRPAAFLSEDYIGEDNVETVFAIKYTYKGVSWDVVDNAGANSGYLDSRNATNGNKWQKFIGLRSQQAPYASGWGFCTVNEALYNSYNSQDRRRDASIIDIENEIPDYDETDQRQYTGYSIKKFVPTLDANGKPTVENLGGDTQLAGFDDWPVIRFADVLLMGAELFLDTDLAKAQTWFDAVRSRAFESDFPTNTVTLVNSQVGIDAIMQERKLELAFEGLRYFDLLRQGLAVAKQSIDNLTGDDFNVEFKTATGGFFEIPQNQINLSNGALEPSVGY
jgi:hypothetical protein